MVDSVSPRQFSREALEPLKHALPGKPTTIRGNIIADSCGRNNVWRLCTTNDQIYFAKLWHDKNEFARELCGLRLGEELARAHSSFMAARVVYADDLDLILVTEQMAGTPLSEMFAAAYRIDKNPVRAPGPRTTVRQAIALLLVWLKEFHKLAAADFVAVYDHSIQGVRQRINDKLTATINGKTFMQHLGISQLDEYRFT
ncbi:MAG: hypothetical protein ABGZ35_33045, partial [Planctomycetaceae bacterium]